MPRKKSPDWDSMIDAHQRAGTEATTPPQGDAPGPIRRPRVVKISASYRLPPDVLDLLDQAVQDAAARGERLTKEDAVAQAIRQTYGAEGEKA